MPPEIDNNKCNACGVCFTVCPQDVFWGSEKKLVPVISYPEECWHCNGCVLDCPVQEAITLRLPLPMFVCYK
jgi:adenylylsulfate reductase, subunit B